MTFEIKADVKSNINSFRAYVRQMREALAKMDMELPLPSFGTRADAEKVLVDIEENLDPKAKFTLFIVAK